ncbi:hypothetical protein B0H10DRAFT_1960931 [Mycena sp. CBHHK59/15]|nr:hypothetical protein B0H10DRAFT_1960931 [Mycena sp. CBHHK59/15]
MRREEWKNMVKLKARVYFWNGEHRSGFVAGAAILVGERVGARVELAAKLVEIFKCVVVIHLRILYLAKLSEAVGMWLAAHQTSTSQLVLVSLISSVSFSSWVAPVGLPIAQVKGVQQLEYEKKICLTNGICKAFANLFILLVLLFAVHKRLHVVGSVHVQKLHKLYITYHNGNYTSGDLHHLPNVYISIMEGTGYSDLVSVHQDPQTIPIY